MANTDKEKVTVLGTWPSPYAMRPIIALELKGVAYQLLEEVPALPVKTELLLKSNPVYKKVPVLIHGIKSICESMIILEYIDETWASSEPSLLPDHPLDRAIARFWAVYIDDKWFPALFGFMKVQTDEVFKQINKELQILQEAFQSCSKESFLSDSVVKKVIPGIDKCVEYGKVLQAKLRASAASSDN